ncbi:MAG: MFS transporter [Planctomycetota bacterium]|nr:MFS transporter [Planctomycetota bacterium]
MSSRASIREVYFNRRMAAILGLGFASGLPLMLTQDTMQAWLVKSGVSVKEIGLFGLVGIPYSLKFLWAPLLDRYAPPWLGPLGRRRGWIVAAQLGLILALVAMATATPVGKDLDLVWFTLPWIMLFGLLAMLAAFLSATQDIVIDAYRTDVLPRAELGAGAAMNVNGYRLAMILAGGGAMVLGARMGYTSAYGVMAGAMLLGLLATLLAPEPAGSARAPATLEEAIVDPFREFFQRLGWRGWLVLLFILLFKIHEVTIGWQTVPFLTTSAGFSGESVGFARGVLGVLLTIVGANAGGAVVARLGLVRALWVVGALGALSNAGFLLLAAVGNSPVELANLDLPWFGAVSFTRGQALMAGVVGLEAFCNGLVTAGFVAFLMSQCDRRYSATQYALLSSVMGLTGVLFRTPTGYVVEWLGWPGFFLATILVGIPGMAMLPWLSGAIERPEERE